MTTTGVMESPGGQFVIRQAKDLKTEDASNPEYDRALVELTMRLLGLDEDHRDAVAKAIGVNE
jgi:hypothetical protein